MEDLSKIFLKQFLVFDYTTSLTFQIKPIFRQRSSFQHRLRTHDFLVRFESLQDFHNSIEECTATVFSDFDIDWLET